MYVFFFSKDTVLLLMRLKERVYKVYNLIHWNDTYTQHLPIIKPRYTTLCFAINHQKQSHIDLAEYRQQLAAIQGTLLSLANSACPIFFGIARTSLIAKLTCIMNLRNHILIALVLRSKFVNILFCDRKKTCWLRTLLAHP